MTDGLARDTRGELQSHEDFLAGILKRMPERLREETAARMAMAPEDRPPLQQPKMVMALRGNGLEGDQLHNTFATYRTDNEPTRLEAKRQAVRFVHEVKTGTRTKGLHFYGRPGRGKDHLLHAITAELAKARIDVYYGYALDIKHKMLGEWQRHSDPETAIEERMSACKVLCIGDLHKVLYVRQYEGVRDREVREAFMRVLNKASSTGSPLLCVSGNIDPQDYASREFGGYDDGSGDIDGAIYSRLQGCTIAIEVQGQDMRQEQR